MRILKFVKVVVPELVAYVKFAGEKVPDYRCTCGYGVAEEYVCCPYCGAILNWKCKSRRSKEFKKLIDSL